MIQTIDLWIGSPESPAIIVSILGDFFLFDHIHASLHQKFAKWSFKPPAGVNLTEWPLSQTFINSHP